MGFESQKIKIRKICKELLETGAADTIIGYIAGGIEGMRIPYIFNDPDDAMKMEWDQRCVPVLCGYAHGRKDKFGIVAKPCDARGIVNYIVEGQLKRDQAYIIGVDCVGMIDAQGEPTPGCAECKIKTPPVFDVRVEFCESDVEPNGFQDESDPCEAAEVSEARDMDDGVLAIDEAESQNEKLARFYGEIKKCILCFSCRQACYGCYCPVCFMDRDTLEWQPLSSDNTNVKAAYHLGRAMHLSGRCVGCGACERVCASGVNVRYIIKSITDYIENEFDFRTGLDVDTEPVMTAYRNDDRDIDFMKEKAND